MKISGIVMTILGGCFIVLLISSMADFLNTNPNGNGNGQTPNIPSPTKPIQLSSTAHYSTILPSSTEVSFLTTIKSGDDKNHENTPSPPKDVMIILDNSGSMAGSRIEKSKKVIKIIVNSLSDDDYIHLITFNSASRTEFFNEKISAKNREKILRMVDRVRAGGSTNMYDGLKDVEAILEHGEVKKREKSQKRIFLFSDGEVNEGETRQGVISEKVKELYGNFGVVTSTFGVGLGFNEDLMVEMAEKGFGQFFYIEDEKMIEKVVSIAFKGFLNTLGTDATLKIGKAILYDGDNEVNSMNCKVKLSSMIELIESDLVKVGDIRKNDYRRIYMSVEVSELDLHKGSMIKIPIELRYLDRNKEEQVILDSITYKISNNDEEVRSSVSNKVHMYSELQKIHKRDEEVTVLLDKGMNDEAYNVKSALINDMDEGIKYESEDCDDEEEYKSMMKEVEVVKRRFGQVRYDIKRNAESAKKYQKFATIQNVRRSEEYDEL